MTATTALTMTPARRVAAGLGAAVLLAVPLSGCSSSSTPEAGATATSAAAGATSGVDCSMTSCTVTFTGDGTSLDVLGTEVSLGQVQDGRATLGVAGTEVSCSQGETVSAGPLQIECTTISPDNVVMTASLG